MKNSLSTSKFAESQLKKYGWKEGKMAKNSKPSFNFYLFLMITIYYLSIKAMESVKTTRALLIQLKHRSNLTTLV